MRSPRGVTDPIFKKKIEKIGKNRNSKKKSPLRVFLKTIDEEIN